MESYIPRFFEAPTQSFFLFGPRGTGKSTYLQRQYPDALWIDLLKPDVFRTYAARPERLIELVHGNPDKKTVVVDEVQKVPDLLSAVHSLIEEKSNKTFVLTGSSARKLKRTGIDLLAGRVLLRTLPPFLLSELPARASLDDALQFVFSLSSSPHRIRTMFLEPTSRYTFARKSSSKVWSATLAFSRDSWKAPVSHTLPC